MDTLELGGHIQLTGFSNIERNHMVVVKKIVGNYTKKLSDKTGKFEELQLTMKPVHETEASKLYELHAKLMDNGKPVAAEATDRNLFVALDIVLKKVESSLG